MDYLLGPGQERWVGVGEGKLGEEEEEDREAGQKQACSLLTTSLGALCARIASSPRGKAQGK